MFRPVGALTSKPYAFISRPWEISSSEGIDFFDSFLSSIRIDEKGLKIVRIVPSINSSLNGDWISDRIRFFYSFQDNQRLVDNFIFYDNTRFFTSSNAISLLLFLSFSKNNSFFYNFGVPTPYEFQQYFFCFSYIFNVNYFTFSNNNVNSDIREHYIPKPNKVIFSNVSTNQFFILNFNTRFSLPIFNIFCRSEFSKSSYPIFYFGSSYYSNFNNFFNLGSNIFNFFSVITSKARVNKVISHSFTFFTPSSNFSKFINNFYFKKINSNTFEKKFNTFYNFYSFEYDSSSIISSELNFKNFKFCIPINSAYNKIIDNSVISVSFNSYNSFNMFSSKFNFNFESNFDFHSASSDNINVTDFLVSIPSIFSYSSTFFSIDGSFKSSNDYKKLDNMFEFIYNYFKFFSSSFGFTKSFFNHFFIFYKNTNPEMFYDTFSFYTNKKSIFSYKSNYSSDFFYSKESARSHYLRSPLTRYSIPLVLHYSRLKNSLFNHI
jgi:hypothetical protein